MCPEWVNFVFSLWSVEHCMMYCCWKLWSALSQRQGAIEMFELLLLLLLLPHFNKAICLTASTNIPIHVFMVSYASFRDMQIKSVMCSCCPLNWCSRCRSCLLRVHGACGVTGRPACCPLSVLSFLWWPGPCDSTPSLTQNVYCWCQWFPSKNFKDKIQNKDDCQENKPKHPEVNERFLI